MYGENTIYVNNHFSKAISKNILSHYDFSIVSMIYSNMDRKNNIFYSYVNKINSLELSKMLFVDRRKVMAHIEKFENLGILAKVNDNVNKGIIHLVLNHNIAFKDGIILDNDIKELFNNTIITKLIGENHFERGVESLKNIPKEDNIYVLCQEIKGDVIYKLGYSSNIRQRIKNYIYHNPAIQIVKTFRIENGKEFEKSFHNNNKSCHLNEWYSINPLEIIGNQLN